MIRERGQPDPPWAIDVLASYDGTRLAHTYLRSDGTARSLSRVQLRGLVRRRAAELAKRGATERRSGGDGVIGCSPTTTGI